MRKFLAQPDAAFYHVTTSENWESIQKSALYPNSMGRIFVSRYDLDGILFSIAISQLPGPDDQEEKKREEVDLVILKLPQSVNFFESKELAIDFQSTEPTMPFQNILLRPQIPLSGIEFVRPIKTNITEMGTVANRFEAGLSTSPIFHESLALTYLTPNLRQYVVDAEQPKQLWKFTQRFL